MITIKVINSDIVTLYCIVWCPLPHLEPCIIRTDYPPIHTIIKSIHINYIFKKKKKILNQFLKRISSFPAVP